MGSLFALSRCCRYGSAIFQDEYTEALGTIVPSPKPKPMPKATSNTMQGPKPEEFGAETDLEAPE